MLFELNVSSDDDVSGAAALEKELAAIESGSGVKRDEQVRDK